MRKSSGLIATIALALAAIDGSAAHGAPPPPSGGTISIEPAEGADDAAMRAVVGAAADALTARGFTVFEDPGHAASVIELRLSRSDVGTATAKATGERAALIGTGVAVPLATGNSRLVSLQRTRLEMRIRRRGDTDIAWDGTAVTVRREGTREGADATVASDLVRALLQSYPAQPKDVVGVP